MGWISSFPGQTSKGRSLVTSALAPEVRACATDPATPSAGRRKGVDKLYEAIRACGRPVDALLANAGRGLGHGFLDQEPDDWRDVVETNITGTLDLIQRVGRDMRENNEGRILITGSIAGFIPGSYQAVYNASKAFLDSFAFALRNELKDTDVTVTCLMPGATETEFFDHADMRTRKSEPARKTIPPMSPRQVLRRC
jgi:short-subunit dehydrogenase